VGKHLEINKKYEQERKLRFEKELKENPPLPPWLKYPNYSRYDMFWRMGTGETYLMEYIHPYFKYASKVEIRKYKQKYLEPEEWVGWYE
jgi:hypothetical protein